MTAGDDWIPNQLFWRGFSGYEGETTRLFYRLARESRCTIDVGAYIGIFSLLAALANSEGQVIAFEPLDTLQSRLSANCVANNVQDRVTIVPSAVSDVDGVATFFHMTDNDTPSSSSLSYEFMSHLEDRDALSWRRVPTVRLDTFCNAHAIERVDLVKIDVETTEASVIQGMLDILHRDQPDIVCELLTNSTAPAKIEPILSSLAYGYFLLTADGPIQREEIAPSATWRNWLFTTREPRDVSAMS